VADADAGGWLEAVAAGVAAGEGVLPAAAEGLSAAAGAEGVVASPQATTRADAAEAARKRRRDMATPSNGAPEPEGAACEAVI
jgi:hypothetical protein